MNDDLSTAIKKLANQAATQLNPLHAMQFAQAALSLAHALQITEELKPKEPSK